MEGNKTEVVECIRTALGMKEGMFYPAIRNRLNKLVIRIGEGQPNLVLKEEQLRGYGIVSAVA